MTFHPGTYSATFSGHVTPSGVTTLPPLTAHADTWDDLKEVIKQHVSHVWPTPFITFGKDGTGSIAAPFGGSGQPRPVVDLTWSRA